MFLKLKALRKFFLTLKLLIKIRAPKPQFNPNLLGGFKTLFFLLQFFFIVALITNFVMWLHFDYFKNLQSFNNFIYSFIVLTILLGVWFLLIICFLIIKKKKK